MNCLCHQITDSAVKLQKAYFLPGTDNPIFQSNKIYIKQITRGEDLHILVN